MQKLRPGGGYDEITRPEGLAFAKVKSMGRKAYPYLVKYINHVDRGIGRAANTVLNMLTGRKSRFSAADVDSCKREWEVWIEKN